MTKASDRSLSLGSSRSYTTRRARHRDLSPGLGGILWGEHGRGVRGQFADRFLPADTVTVMRRVKTAFDPNDRFNPGKLYRPLGRDDGLTRIDGVPTRASVNRTVPVEIRRQFQPAFSCNGIPVRLVTRRLRVFFPFSILTEKAVKLVAAPARKGLAVIRSGSA